MMRSIEPGCALHRIRDSGFVLRAPRNDEGRKKCETSTYALLLFGALAGGFVSGLAGFGTALMALGIWLYVLPPSLAVPLVLICSVSSQISTLPTMWKVSTSNWPRRSSSAGSPACRSARCWSRRPNRNIQIERRGDAAGVSGRAVFRPQADGVRLRRQAGGRGLGFAGGILGGLAGLSGPLPTLWASVRGWTKDQRRGVFQIFNGSVLGAALRLQIISGFVKWEVFWLALLALPGTMIGAWIGARTYQALSDRNFDDIVLGLLFLSGLALVWSSIAPR